MKKLFQFVKGSIPGWYLVVMFMLIGIIILGLLLPPPGALDGNLVAAIGLMVVALFIGMLPSIITSGAHVKFVKGDTSIEVEPDDDSKE